ncbi:MAG: PilC/PilY family type IV pilus protein [Rhizobacter sp.]
MKSKTIWLQPKRLGAMTIIATMLSQTVTPAFATVSQSPGLFAAPPDPNVMITLDDSGSMQADAIPDFTDTSGMPAASGSNSFFSLQKYPNMWASGSSYLGITYYRSDNAIARYMRSSSGNPLYYNPNVRYLPWPDATNDTGLNANATTNAVRVSTDTPFSGGTTIDLTTRVNVSGGAGASDDQTKNYWPATYYVYDSTKPALPFATPNTALNVATSFTKVEIKPFKTPGSTSTPSTFAKVAARTDCSGAIGATGCSYTEELKNFANWLQYYHNRRLMAKGGIAAALAKQGTNLRLGFASINSSPVVRIGVSQFSGANRTAFYNNLYPLGNQASIFTPLRAAMDSVGKYFQRSNVGNPWAQDPTSATVGKEYTCRKSFHILSTDGFWNDAGATAPANADNDSFSGFTPYKPDGTTRYAYSDTGGSSANDPLVGRFAISPFGNSTAISQTLADVAAYYWKTDLRSDLANNVSPSSRDPAFWQHLTTFTVGLGITGSGGVTKAVTTGTPPPANLSTQASIDLLIANKTALNWTDPGGTSTGGGDNAATGDDLIHAAMNGRGRYFSATDPTTLANGLASALAEATDQSVSSANVATNSAQVSAGSLAFQATYNSYRWAGRLYAFSESATGTVTTTPSTAVWEASNMMPAPDARNIYTWNAVSPKQGAPFTWAGLNASQQLLLNNDSTLLDYLRGSGTKEIQNGGTLRDRSRYTVGAVTGGVLGDIVNGSPIKGPDGGGGYDKLSSSVPGQLSYATYRSNSVTTLDNMRNTVFAGANDGMLHAFNAVDGVERFAFVPNSVFNVPRSVGGTSEQKLKLLTDPAYTHRFTVDGPPQIGDAFFGTVDAITGWKTVLTSTTGAGARSVFAIDVTNPKVESGGFDKTKVLWEFSEADNSDMGFVLSYPHIARMRNGQWVAIFGNGYDSSLGQAKLFILDLQTGALVWEQAVGSAGGNGLSQPNFTVNANREVESIYAGDLKGNLWKFDVNNANPSSWKVDFSGAPLYTAPTGPASAIQQPITVMPEITYHPNGGALISFGTGELFQTEDTAATGNINLNTQAIYGVWDKPGETTGFSGLSKLVAQTDKSLTAAADTTLKGTTSNSIDWATKRGWYLNLQTGGERVNVNPLQVKSVLLVVANTPAPDPCGAGGTSRLFALDPLTGGAPTFAVFNANLDSTIGSADIGYNVRVLNYAVLSLPTLQTKGTLLSGPSVDPVYNNRGQTGALGGGVEVKAPGTQSDCSAKLLAGASDTSVLSSDISLCSNGKGRISWRQIK